MTPSKISRTPRVYFPEVLRDAGGVAPLLHLAVELVGLRKVVAQALLHACVSRAMPGDLFASRQCLRPQSKHWQIARCPSGDGNCVARSMRLRTRSAATMTSVAALRLKLDPNSRASAFSTASISSSLGIFHSAPR